MRATTDRLNRFNPQLWTQFWKLAKPYWFSEDKWRAGGLLLVLLILAIVVNAINVGISFIFRDINTSLANFPQTNDTSTFWRLIWKYVGIMVIATPIVVLFGYLRDKLGLYWREWMTYRFLGRYLQNRAYYQMNCNDAIDNPDQRISEDIRTFTRTSLFFLLVILNSTITLISFTGVLLSISLTLSAALLLYAIIGTVITAWIGQRLIGINFNQLRQEADFRYGLIHIRDNAESIAFYGGEERELMHIRRRFLAAIRNFNLLIAWDRNLSCFTTGYDYFVRAVPLLIVAPIYFAGNTDFGAITQAAIAFNQIFSALSIIVSQFENLTAFAAGINRLGSFADALEPASIQPPGATTISATETSHLGLCRVTLLTPNYQRTLVKNLTLSVNPGEGLVIIGASGSGKSSILRAIGGLWNAGTGHVHRPRLSEMLFLPQRPYMVLGSLRDQLLYPHQDLDISEDKLLQVLQQVNLDGLPDQVGGFDLELDWTNILSLGEQQRLAFARILLTQPRYVILDEATSALDVNNEQCLYQQLQMMQTTFISVGHRASLLQYHHYILKLEGNADWQMLPNQEYHAANLVGDG
ncbi:MAG TPA: ABC transporter ATP-binding protein [Cyanobacteria bacterium UBA8543]|nr:ABC transporter ATP-binding protein [Cyanobacteria bacterium UBA8543]